MKIIKPSVEIINPIDYKTMLNTVETAIRNSYQSYDKVGEGSAERLIRDIIKLGHDATLEFGDITAKLVTDRANLAQLSRHRIGMSMVVESQRYVNYTKDKFGNAVKFIVPEGLNDEAYDNWVGACRAAEAAYMTMLNDCHICTDAARSVLPNSTAVSIVMKANIREYRHIFKLRCDSHARADMQTLMKMLLERVYKLYPVFFEDIYNEFIGIKVCGKHEL